MPSKTFLNLDSNKQHKLLEVAMHEFSTVPYTEVSINQMIASAGISRGSFYMYFTDKDDLFGYLLEINKKRMHKMTKNVFISCNGDIKDSFLMLYDEATKSIQKYNLARLLKNIFLYFTIHREKFIRPSHALFLYVKDSISTKNIKTDDLEFIFHLFMHNLFISITEAVKSDNVLGVRKQYRHKVNILCYGIYKEEKE